MKRGITFSLVAIVTIAVCATPAWSIDVVYRKSTTTSAQGQVTEVTNQGITIKPRIGSPVTVPANDITRVRWNGEPAKLNLARSDEDGGRLQKALDGYIAGAADVPASAGYLKTDIQYLIARTTAKMALADPQKLDDAAKKLEAFTKAGADSFRYYEAMNFLGQVYLAKQDFDKAKTAFTALAKAPWNDYKMAAKSATARLMLNQKDVAGALAAYEEVIRDSAKATAPGEVSRRYEAMLGKASCLVQQKKFTDAVKSLEDVIVQADARDSRTQAEAYVRQGDCYRELGRTKEAVLAYLHVPVLFSKEKDLHAESLYHLARLWSTVGHPERGADARAILEAEYPNSEWNKKLASAAGG